MAGIIKNLLNVSIVALTLPTMALGAQKENPRGLPTVTRGGATYALDDNSATKKSATSVIARSVTTNNRQGRNAVNSRSMASNTRAAATSDSVRARTATRGTNVRSGAVSDSKSGKGISRANTARATAVFNDVTKIGGGFADCRDAYATCMDQICANSNDTYRRCFCSERFTGFRETSEKLDNALSMLAQFQDNNLEMVDKTAAEVNAMYTASEGEKNIKKDTSASQKLLNSISNILADRSTTKKSNDLTSLGVLDFSAFNVDDDDIWGGSSSIFGESSYEDLSALEGKELYTKAHKQCEEIVRDSCKNDATFNLARSSYSIMISQDCNLYEKSINAKRASVEETVRTAEKYLREARLEEYRAHNSADVIECLTKVEEAARNDVVCGANYEKCMDYTGRYIDVNTGEPIYGPKLFGLNSLIILDGSADVLKTNASYDKWLDAHVKDAVGTALDSCRDISGKVWTEFKRSALIQIAQAQDKRIQDIKDSCVSTIKDCYDTQSDTIEDMDISEGKYAGGVGAWATRGLCYEKVLACAALYGDQDGCRYDDKTKKISNANGKKCGLQALLTYVDTVDAVRVAEGCETGLRKKARELCDDADAGYPLGCRNVTSADLKTQLDKYRESFCPEDAFQSDDANVLSSNSAFNNARLVEQVVNEIYSELGVAMLRICEDDKTIKGTWVSERPLATQLSTEFYKKYFGKTSISSYDGDQVESLKTADGWCEMGTEQQQCIAQQFATWDSENGCSFTNEWYRNRCEMLGSNARWRAGTSVCEINGVTYTEDDID